MSVWFLVNDAGSYIQEDERIGPLFQTAKKFETKKLAEDYRMERGRLAGFHVYSEDNVPKPRKETPTEDST